jgi:glucose/arabinose dehydrogenase
MVLLKTPRGSTIARPKQNHVSLRARFVSESLLVALARVYPRALDSLVLTKGGTPVTDNVFSVPPLLLPRANRRNHRAIWRPKLEALEDRVTPTNLPDGFSESLVASGMSSPTAMAQAPDGRIFVDMQGGDARVIKDGNLLPTPFVHFNVDSSGERGLLGVAFDPDFANNQYVYFYYTVPGSPAHNRVSRFTADGDVAMAGSEVVLLDLDNLSGATNHNGGGLHFGLDGKLYISVGENANPNNSQTLSNLLGKMLRINPDGSIPDDNPYVGVEGARGEIWALGFRNPYTFAVQPGSGRIFVNDVGSSPPNAREEINDLGPGGNYGWPKYEGYTDDPDYVSPLYAYASGVTDPDTGDFVCAIVGGTFYNPDNTQFPPEYTGTYFFSDLCGHWIKQFNADTGDITVFATASPGNKVDLLVDPNGSLFYLSQDSGGRLYRIDYSPPETTSPPAARAALENLTDLAILRMMGNTWQLGSVTPNVETPSAGATQSVRPDDADQFLAGSATEVRSPALTAAKAVTTTSAPTAADGPLTDPILT